MHLDLTNEETAALTQELHDIIESNRYPLSPRIRTLRGILGKLRPEPVRQPLPPFPDRGEEVPSGPSRWRNVWVQSWATQPVENALRLMAAHRVRRNVR